ncbi:MAG: hypothetical protein R6V62_10895 [Candidatus Fermentibacteraceae bacterium]
MVQETLESDIRYVRALVERSGNGSFPRSVYILWAVIVLLGFSIIDFKPGWTGIFWMVAGPGGSIISGILGHRAGVRMGQLDREIGVRHALHWGGMLVVIVLAVVLAIRGFIHGTVLSQVILLLVALGWWTAGVHFDRNFLWFAAVMILGFVGTLFSSSYTWTVIGVLLAVNLVIAALRKRKGEAENGR